MKLKRFVKIQKKFSKNSKMKTAELQIDMDNRYLDNL